jgi:predicted DNA-binding transcriptional regulator YafY
MREQGGPMGLLPVSPRESLLPLELEEALDQRGAVLMEYLDARQKRTQRVVEPLSVRRSNGELLLVAHCQLRNDRRTFKLDRIVQLRKVDHDTAVQLVRDSRTTDCPPDVGPALDVSLAPDPAPEQLEAQAQVTAEAEPTSNV